MQGYKVSKFNKNQNGFGLIAVLLLVFVAAVIVGGVYYVGTQQSKKSDKVSSSDSAANSSTDPTKNWKTYTQPADKSVSFRYPDNWKIGDFDGADTGNGVRNISLTSPSGTELDMRSTGAGLGGECLETQHTKVTYSSPIAGASDKYVVGWEMFDGSESLGSGLDVLNGDTQGSKVYTEVGDHTACITFSFAFTSPLNKDYFFGLKSDGKLDPKDESTARQILGSLTLK